MSKNEKFHQNSGHELNDDALNAVAGGKIELPVALCVCPECGAEHPFNVNCPNCSSDSEES